jgi:site-specific DNA-adenine methylase
MAMHSGFVVGFRFGVSVSAACEDKMKKINCNVVLHHCKSNEYVLHEDYEELAQAYEIAMDQLETYITLMSKYEDAQKYIGTLKNELKKHVPNVPEPKFAVGQVVKTIYNPNTFGTITGREYSYENSCWIYQVNNEIRWCEEVVRRLTKQECGS